MLLDFEIAMKKTTYSWFEDLSFIFDEVEGAYIDSVHVYDFANKEIAKRIFEKLIQNCEIIREIRDNGNM